MKTLNQIMLLVMTLSLVTLSSCKSDDDGGAAGGAAAGTLAASIDGVAFQSLDISSSATVTAQSLSIVATNADAKAFAIGIVNYSGPGTYPIGGGANIFNTASYSETDVDINNPMNSTTEIWQAPFDDTVVGEINISEETDTKVIGTFNFTGKNVNGDQSEKVITDGSFDLNKQDAG